MQHIVKGHRAKYRITDSFFLVVNYVNTNLTRRFLYKKGRKRNVMKLASLTKLPFTGTLFILQRGKEEGFSNILISLSV